MNIHDAIKNMKAIEDSSMDGVVEELENKFGSLPETVQELLVIRPEHYETNKTDPLIKLNKTGILNFNYNFDYDMLENGMIPLFDAFDARYIVYRVEQKDFCVFSTISEKPSWMTNDIYALIDKYF